MYCLIPAIVAMGRRETNNPSNRKHGVYKKNSVVKLINNNV